MPWQSVLIERDKLYREVWSEPMTVVSARYGISDVGLRKVCRKLGVPMPIAGHWAKVRAGKTTRKAALPTDWPIARHEVRRLVEPGEAELAKAVAALHEEPVQAVEVAPVAIDDDLHRSVRNTLAALEKAGAESKGRISLSARGTLDVRVGLRNITRAALLCEAVLRAFKAASMVFEERLSTHQGPRFKAGPYWYVLRITEFMDSAEQSAASPSGLAVHLEGPRRRSGITGTLKLDFIEEGTRGAVLTFRDNASGRLESKVALMPAELRLTSQATQLKAEHQEAQRRAAEAEREERRRLIELRNTELERLKKAEALAEQWRRAEALRGYGSAIEKSGIEGKRLTEQALAERVSWLRRAADWLDPTSRAHWPEVDDAPNSYW